MTLEAKARAVIEQASDHYIDRRGKRRSVERQDGEECFVVPFDAIEELRAALTGFRYHG